MSISRSAISRRPISAQPAAVAAAALPFVASNNDAQIVRRKQGGFVETLQSLVLTTLAAAVVAAPFVPTPDIAPIKRKASIGVQDPAAFPVLYPPLPFGIADASTQVGKRKIIGVVEADASHATLYPPLPGVIADASVQVGKRKWSIPVEDIPSATLRFPPLPVGVADASSPIGKRKWSIPAEDGPSATLRFPPLPFGVADASSPIGKRKWVAPAEDAPSQSVLQAVSAPLPVGNAANDGQVFRKRPNFTPAAEQSVTLSLEQPAALPVGSGLDQFAQNRRIDVPYDDYSSLLVSTLAPTVVIPPDNGGWPTSDEIGRYRRATEQAHKLAQKHPEVAKAVVAVKAVARIDYIALKEATILEREAALRRALEEKKQRLSEQRMALYMEYLNAELFRLREEESVFVMMIMAATEI